MNRRGGSTQRWIVCKTPPRIGTLRHRVYEMVRVRPGITTEEICGELRLSLYELAEIPARKRLRNAVYDLLEDGYLCVAPAYAVPIGRIPATPSFAQMVRTTIRHVAARPR